MQIGSQPYPFTDLNPATEEKQDALAMIFTDSVRLDSFGRLRVSTANTLFDSQQEYGLDTRTTWDISANGTLPSATSESTKGDLDSRNPFTLSQIDALAANQIPVSIVCTSFSGTSNISAIMNWHEQII